jgi:hypothetical protein
MNLEQTIYDWLGSTLRLEQMQSLADYKLSFAASWAQRAPMLLFFGIVALVAAAAWYYFRNQPTRHHRWRAMLFVIRAAVLCQVLLLLAEPILTLTIQSRKRPGLWLLFDGTDSMNIADDLPPDVRAATDKAVGLETSEPADAAPAPADKGAAPADKAATASADKSPGEQDPAAAQRHSRVDYLRALVQKKDQNLLELLGKQFRLQAFLFDSTQSVRSLELGRGLGPFDGKHLAEQLTANGQVTDIGGALTDLAHRNPSSSLAGLVVFSDFNKTTGPDPAKVAQQFGTKIYTIGVGATRAIDLVAKIVAAPYAKTKDEVPIKVFLQPSGLEGQSTHVRLYAEPLGGGSSSRTLVGEKESPQLTGSSQTVEFIFKPDQVGRVHLVAEVDRLPGEVNREKNLAHAEISVLDDYLRLMFVEFEPTWEWRFIKEVFHRDPLVGMKGFRTFLYSSDPQVRQQNELFLASMTPPREEFFKNDLIFLGDMPSGPPTPALSEHFCKLVKEFVGDMGGGLVVLCGPRFGPQQLAKTALADLLPVAVDPAARVRDQEPFNLQLTAQAAEFPFMQLGAGSTLPEMQKAWDTLGPLPWYQPVEGVHPAATVLAEHPTATCANGKKQPLIAIRQYGRGEVVYLGFDETWRLRRAHGEELFRRFWKEVMWRLALNHALGANKRFVVQTDLQRYQVDQTVTLTVTAGNAQYKALTEADVPSGKLNGQWVLPAVNGQAPVVQPLSLTQVQPGLFSTRFIVTAPGEHHVRVTDPMTQKPVEWTFTAFNLSVERQSPIRNSALQEAIAAESNGRSYDLKDVQSLLEQIQPSLRTETSVEVVSLLNTWACFLVIAGLLLGEWFLRKRIGLP